MPDRILFLSYLSGIGGGETFLLNHASRLDRAEFAPHVILASEGPLLERLRQLEVSTTVLPYRKDRSAMSALAVVGSLIRTIRRNRIRLVHLNDMELGKFGAIAARLCGVPVIWTCHGWWYASPPREVFYRVMLDRVVSVSHAVQSSLTRRGILAPRQACVIHPGIDLERFAPAAPDVELAQQWELPPGRVTVAIVGRFQPIKGHDVFLDAARLVARACPEAEFLIIGGNVFGVDEDAVNHRRLLARVEADPELRSRVRFLPFQSDMARAFSVVDLLVSASDAETFGMVHVEAMACGKPVVSTDRGGPADIVADGTTGFLVPPRNPEALAKRMIELCENPELRARMGEAGRARALEHFDVERQSASYQALYRQLP